MYTRLLSTPFALSSQPGRIFDILKVLCRALAPNPVRSPAHLARTYSLPFS